MPDDHMFHLRSPTKLQMCDNVTVIHCLVPLLVYFSSFWSEVLNIFVTVLCEVMPIRDSEVHFPSQNCYRDSSAQVGQVFIRGLPVLTCILFHTAAHPPATVWVSDPRTRNLVRFPESH